MGMHRARREKVWDQKGLGPHTPRATCRNSALLCASALRPLTGSLLSSQSQEGMWLDFLCGPLRDHRSVQKSVVLKQVPTHHSEIGVELWGQSVVTRGPHSARVIGRQVS